MGYLNPMTNFSLIAIYKNDRREVTILHIFFHTIGSGNAFTSLGSPPEEEEEALVEPLQFVFELEE